LGKASGKPPRQHHRAGLVAWLELVDRQQLRIAQPQHPAAGGVGAGGGQAFGSLGNRAAEHLAAIELAEHRRGLLAQRQVLQIERLRGDPIGQCKAQRQAHQQQRQRCQPANRCHFRLAARDRHWLVFAGQGHIRIAGSGRLDSELFPAA
jgi:hypothetical protein